MKEPGEDERSRAEAREDRTEACLELASFLQDAFRASSILEEGPKGLQRWNQYSRGLFQTVLFFHHFHHLYRS